MPYTVIDGTRLETRIIPGAAGQPWLVFLHEGLGSVSLWRDFPEKLARRLDMPALVYSRRGYGQSDALAGPREPDFMHREALDVLPKLLDALSIERVFLIGHSDGASIALIHAAHQPERLAGAVLMLAYGLGLLLWIWALRLLLVQLPTAAMRQEIRRPLPTPLLA